MYWRIHCGLIGTREAELSDLLTNGGDTVQFVSGRRPELPIDPQSITGGALALTTIQDAKLLAARWPVSPGLYFHPRKYDVSYWLPRTQRDIPALNRGAFFVPFGLVPSIAQSLWTSGIVLSDGLLFVRPDSGLKPFAGFVVDCNKPGVKNWQGVADEIAREVRHLAPETLICIATGRKLKPVEWRFWIVDRKVVASAPYSWDSGALLWRHPPYDALRCAEAMAQNPWQPDIAYVADVVQLDGGDEPFYLNEINAASTSGLYNVLAEPLFDALRSAVVRELAGEISIED